MAASVKILVADDDSNDKMLLRRAIEKAGLRVQVDFVDDGQEAIDYLQSASSEPPPTMLLLDLNMPRLDGFDVLEWLRHEPDRRPRTVVVYSSSPRSEDIHRSGELGVDYYVVKPSEPSELVATMKRLEPFCYTERPPRPAVVAHHNELAAA